MSGGALSVALTAGMLAALNPCGFALLPAYLALLVSDGRLHGWRAVPRAVTATAAMTTGFVAVFGVFGLVVAPLASSVEQYLPWVTVATGALLAVGGVWLLLGHDLPGLPATAQRSRLTGSLGSIIGFGLSYALASLSCTITPFLALVVFSLRTQDYATGVASFVAYAVGMGLVVGTAALAVALANTSVVGLLRSAGRAVHTASAVLLIVVGAYVGYYGVWELNVLSGAATDDRVVQTASALQHVLTALTQHIGPLGFLLAATVVGITLGLLTRRTRRRTAPARGTAMRRPQSPGHRSSD
jgi:cytochrome c-type biogenesis protein